jgi:hypothetical protein
VTQPAGRGVVGVVQGAREGQNSANVAGSGSRLAVKRLPAAEAPAGSTSSR